MNSSGPAIEAIDFAELQRVLSPLCLRFEAIKVFGSRATGLSRRTSDLDLVVYGADRRAISSIVEALEESLLPMTADVLAYETITNDALREHIDRFAKPLPLGAGTLDTASVQATGE